MSYTFTASEQQQIQNALAQCTGLTWNGDEYVEVRLATTNALPFYTTLSNLLAQKLDNKAAFDTETVKHLESAKLWMDVAIGANGGTGTLIGGEGNDRLHGGAGMDRYEYSGDFGHDQVIDSDGSGKMWANGAPLGSTSGLVKVGENVWETQDRQLVLTHSTLGLIIGRRISAGASTVDATIVVRNWQNGQLGIDLPQAPQPGHPTAPAGVFFLHGDQNISTDPVHKDKLDQVQPDGSWTYGTVAPEQDDFYKAGGIRQTDENGTPLRDAEGRIIYVDPGRVEYDGRGGNDVIAGYQDNDTLKGGDGDDVISRGAGSDYLWGGPRGWHHGSCVLRHSHRSMPPVAVAVELIRERLAWAGGISQPQKISHPICRAKQGLIQRKERSRWDGKLPLPDLDGHFETFATTGRVVH